MFNVQTRLLYPDLIPKMDKINEMLRIIGEKITSLVDPKNSDGTLLPKIVYKLKTYIETSRQRILDFSFSICDLWNIGNVGGAFVILRCIYENEAYLNDLYEKLKKNIENKDFSSCDKIIMRRIFGAKMKDISSHDIGNVLTLIDKLDKKLSGFRNHYDILSEFVHPNYSAMAGLYCNFFEEPYPYVKIDGAVGFNKDNLIKIIDSLIPVLMGVDLFINQIEELYPALSELSEDSKKV